MDRTEENIRNAALGWPENTFLRADDLAAVLYLDAPTVAAYLHILANDPDVTLRLAVGDLFWKPKMSRFGPSAPDPVSTAYMIAHDQAPGLAGWAVLNVLGLSTQVPAVYEIAIIGPEPLAIRHVTWVIRENRSRLELTPNEIAIIETAWAWDRCEMPARDAMWTMRRVVGGFQARHSIRSTAIRAALRGEPEAVRHLARRFLGPV